MNEMIRHDFALKRFGSDHVRGTGTTIGSTSLGRQHLPDSLAVWQSEGPNVVPVKFWHNHQPSGSLSLSLTLSLSNSASVCLSVSISLSLSLSLLSLSLSLSLFLCLLFYHLAIIGFSLSLNPWSLAFTVSYFSTSPSNSS